MKHYQDFWDREHSRGTYFQGAGHESSEVVDYVSRIKDRYGKFKHPDSRVWLTNNGLLEYVNIETDIVISSQSILSNNATTNTFARNTDEITVKVTFDQELKSIPTIKHIFT